MGERNLTVTVAVRQSDTSAAETAIPRWPYTVTPTLSAFASAGTIAAGRAPPSFERVQQQLVGGRDVVLCANALIAHNGRGAREARAPRLSHVSD